MSGHLVPSWMLRRWWAAIARGPISVLLALMAMLVLTVGARAQPAPPVPAPFPEALQRAAADLFGKANLSGDRIELVIDPLIDAASGAQSAATRAMQEALIAMVRTSYPRFVVQPFTAEVLARDPVVLVGTFTAISQVGADGPRDAFRICLTLADLKSRTVVSRGVARATPENVDVTPTLFFRDAPVWAKDQATDAYVQTCQGTPLGAGLDPAYVDRLAANALIQDGIAEYEAQRFRESLAFYRAARRLPGGDQHRVRIGTYLASAKLGRRDDAVDAFGDLVDYGLSTDQLMVRLLFRPGSTQFIDNPQTTEPYPMWLSQIATRVRQKGACLEIVGHSSRTGTPSLNERLSVLRAQFIMDLLLTGMPDGRSRMIASGRGFKDNLVGTGKDDASDALDRRVEFKVIGC
ncbi:OmpA family protein [Bosea sp. (in: a-proteobacteria)]|uniref:OmpA family protein n=1 Tax=Bosea sp. (in: a-proteobacteria) TaxID=1871050 RepID=UPI0027353510|nr:OmpA family protein [Bosea sp. (in: a-proteobacteria)]MDP3410982.1 OmpA family protein [Bosea sp. (in: a-proteobacteria)]